MSKHRLPWDVKQSCIWIVRGYDRRVRAYHEARKEIIDGSAEFQPGVCVKNSAISRVAETKLDALLEVESWPETQRMRAVEQAKFRIGDDRQSEQRLRLAENIVLNCMDGKRYPFRYLDLPDFSERDFYRRRDDFLYDIANQLHMV